MNRFVNGALAPIGAGLVSLTASAAFAQSAVTVTVTNNTTASMIHSSPSGCEGTPRPAFENPISAGASATAMIASPYPTSSGCSLRYARSDNLRYCNWVLSRIRSSPSGAWRYPTVHVTSSGSGITCGYRISSVDTNGGWSVALSAS
jgi:hypothetical protein